MEGIRIAWKIFSFSDVPSRKKSSSSSTFRRRRRHRRVPLHRACSLPLTSSLPRNGRTTRPGAYEIVRTRGPARQQRVIIPPGVEPGTEFTAVIPGSPDVQVQCPPTSRPGNFVRVMVPGVPTTRQTFLKMAPLTKLQDDEKEICQDDLAAKNKKKVQEAIKIKVPSNVRPGMNFITTVNGARYSVTCPEKIPRNRKIKIVPVQQQEKNREIDGQSSTEKKNSANTSTSRLFEILIPEGVHPGDFFDVLVYGERQKVQCPEDTQPGQKIRLRLDVSMSSTLACVNYDQTVSHGWIRTVRPHDLKFYWIHCSQEKNDHDQVEPSPDLESDVEGRLDEPVIPFAFCRRLSILEGKDKRLPTGTLSVAQAEQAVIDSSFTKADPGGSSMCWSFQDIVAVQAASLDEKSQWFRNICSNLAGTWEEGNVKIVVRRDHLLEDSIKAVMSLGTDHLRQPWRFEFVHEPAVDSGGVTREWFELVSEHVFDPENGLFVDSAGNQMCVDINPMSADACAGDHLVQFRFAGRLLGRALFDQQMVKGHFVPYLYKHLLGWPLTFEDLADQDRPFFDSLLKLTEMDDVDIGALCLDFTATEMIAGAPTVVELLPDGSNTSVSKSNMEEYLDSLVCYRMMERTKSQLTELLLGFLDVVPEAALAVFDPRELELSLCGLPTINLDDWKANTKYSGTFRDSGKDDYVVQWFWEILDSWNIEMKARLLQFVTGTSGVPSSGFAALRGADGTVKNFAIHGTEASPNSYPRAQTCFNRLDLPRYETKVDLDSKLSAAVTLSAVGFGIH